MNGRVLERPNRTVSKTVVVKATVGSNPTSSASAARLLPGRFVYFMRIVDVAAGPVIEPCRGTTEIFHEPIGIFVDVQVTVIEDILHFKVLVDFPLVALTEYPSPSSLLKVTRIVPLLAEVLVIVGFFVIGAGATRTVLFE